MKIASIEGQYGKTAAREAALRALYAAKPIRFFAEALKIRTKEGLLKPLVLNAAQKKVQKKYEEIVAREEPVRMITLKARQLGSSTFWQAEIFRKVLFSYLNGNPVASHTLSHDQESTNHIFTITKTYLENLPEFLRPPIRKETTTEFVFGQSEDRRRKQRTRLKASSVSARMAIQTAGNKAAGASQTIQFLHLSEVGRYENAEDLLMALMPAVPDLPGTIVTQESTGEEATRYFYWLWNDAIKGESIYEPIFLPWYIGEEYKIYKHDLNQHDTDAEERQLLDLGASLENLAWRRYKLKAREFGGDPRRFKAQYPSTMEEAFLSGGRTVFDEGLLMRVRDHLEKPIWEGSIFSNRLVQRGGGPLWIWEHPKEGKTYDLGVDSSLGGEQSDFCTICVVERGTYKQVAEFQDRVGHVAFGNIIETLGRLYNTGQIGIELNFAAGRYINTELMRSYPNIYKYRPRDRQSPTPTAPTGVLMTHKEKDYQISVASVELARNPTIVKSFRLWDELMQFIIRENGRKEANYGFFDDLVIAWLIGVTISDDVNYERRGFMDLPDEEKPDQPFHPWEVDNWEPTEVQPEIGWLEL